MQAPFPYVTAAAGAFLAVLQMLLLVHTARGRGKFRAGLGDGGSDALLKRIRMHGNLAENAPLFLILLGLAEISGQWSAWLPWLALAFCVARVAHAIGLSISAGISVFRFVGVMGTVFSILILAGLLAVTVEHGTNWLPSLLKV